MFRIPRMRACLFGLACIGTFARAQQPPSIEGRVFGADKRPLESVVIRVDGHPRLGAATDADGRYRIVGLEAGTYVLRASRLGLEEKIDTVTVGDGRTENDFELQVAVTTIAPVTVSATRETRSRREASATIDVLDGSEIRAARASHPGQILKRIPGVYVSQLSGEGHSTAIRQPITTKPMYLYLEDGVPTRPTGFFNHNGLYEVNIPQSGGLEVLKGPGTALYGSDAIGGVINVLTRPAPVAPTIESNIEGGEFGYRRALLSGGFSNNTMGLRADLNLTKMDTWRDHSPFERQSATVRYDQLLGDWTSKTVLTATHVDQNDVLTLTQPQYEARSSINRSPLAYRNVDAARWSTALELEKGNSLWSFTPFARYNVLKILPSWQLTFDPQTWDTRNNSLGVLIKYRRELPSLNGRVIAGTDIDYSPGSFRADRAVLTTTGTGGDRVFQSFASGAHQYDYDVTYKQIAPYVHAEWSATRKLKFDGGARLDAVGYDYDTHLAPSDTGAHRVPASTTRRYTHVSPKIGATYDASRAINLYASYRAGFRAPSQSNLFQQNNALNTVDLKPITAGSYEAGIRGEALKRLVYQVAVYDMTVNDDIITLVTEAGPRVAVNAGKTSHKGVEASAGVSVTSALRVDVAAAVTRQKYEAWETSEAGTATGCAANSAPAVRYDGCTIEAVPAQMANVLLTWSPGFLRGGRIGAEWNHTGKYWMDPENLHEYPGHDLVNFNANYVFSSRAEVFARVLNAFDTNYAEVAAFASNQFQYNPGTPRSVYAGVKLVWQK